MTMHTDLVLMDHNRLMRSLNRMAHEIAEQNSANRPVVLFGIDKRGYAVANLLGDILKPMFEHGVYSFQLFLGEKNISDTKPAFDEFRESGIEEPFIIAVDDVIFSGQTMFSALKKISEEIKVPEIHTAVLIDRGHRSFPIRAEYCGMELPTKLDEHVSVIVDEEELKEVILVNSKE